MSGQLHWWPAAVAFGLGMVLTLTLMMRPAKVPMPAWVSGQPGPLAQPEPPTMKVPASEAPTQRIPVARPRPAKKTAAKVPPRKRRPIPRDDATEAIAVPRKRTAKKVPAKKARPRRPPGRIPVTKDLATQTDTLSEAQTVQIPLVPYAPYGPGSMRADPDGTGPEGWQVKGRTDSRLFYLPDDPGYDDVEAQVWFEDEDFARRAFFMPGRDSAPTSPED